MKLGIPVGYTRLTNARCLLETFGPRRNRGLQAVRKLLLLPLHARRRREHLLFAPVLYRTVARDQEEDAARARAPAPDAPGRRRGRLGSGCRNPEPGTRSAAARPVHAGRRGIRRERRPVRGCLVADREA